MECLRVARSHLERKLIRPFRCREPSRLMMLFSFLKQGTEREGIRATIGCPVKRVLPAPLKSIHDSQSLSERSRGGQRGSNRESGGCGTVAFRDLTEDVQCRDPVGFGIGGEIEDVVDEGFDRGALLQSRLPDMDQFCR